MLYSRADLMERKGVIPMTKPMHCPPTEKQLDYIEFIQEFSGIPFEGNTRKEAAEYIDENKEFARINSIDSWGWNYE